MMFLSRNRRTAGAGVPMWYVFIDESGHAYYDPEDVGPFAVAALIFDDPEAIAAIALRQRSNTKASRKYRGAPGTAEVKHSRSSRTTIQEIMEGIRDSGCRLVATYQPMYSEFDNPRESGAVTYVGTLSRLLIKIANEGPRGVYRIRIDSSDYVDQDLLELIARSAFDGADGRYLAKKKAISQVDSDLEPAIQTVDSFAGEYRQSLIDDDREFNKRNKVIQANRRRRR